MYRTTVNYLPEIKEYALSQFPNECCGFLCVDRLGNHKVVKCENQARNKRNRFSINPIDFMNAEKQGHIALFFHSHMDELAIPNNDRFSKEDIDISEEIAIPALLYVSPQDTWHFHVPITYKPEPLLGRGFIWGVWDCITLVRDYYLMNNRRLCIQNKNPIRDGKVYFDLEAAIRSESFYEVALANIAVGDLIIFKFTDVELPHLAVYLGDNEFLHQSYGGLSQKSAFDTKYMQSIFKVLRLK